MARRKPVPADASIPGLGSAWAVDSHCHVDLPEFRDDLEAVLERARRAGIAAAVTIGAGGSMECNRRAVDLAESHPMIFATVGIHPHDAREASEEAIAEIERLARRERVVAIGETGLDFHYDHSPRPVQRETFARFIALARDLHLPLVVHVREAHGEAAAILEAEKAADVGGVIHCFSGDASVARRYLDLGFHLSFSGILTFPNAEPVRDAARAAPSDRILVETDAPFLAPSPFRGRRNEPALTAVTLHALAAIRSEPVAALAETTRNNTARLFRLPLPAEATAPA